MEVGELVRRHRSRLGLSQEDLAARAALSVRAIRDLERGRVATPRAQSVHRLASALRLAGSDLDELLAASAGPASIATAASAGPSAAALRAPLTAASVTGLEVCTVRSTIDTSGVGTRIAIPSNFPFSAGSTKPIALAAPVEVGIIERAAARARRISECGRSSNR